MELQDIIEIQQLEAFCHHAVDHEDQSLFHLVFAEDARFDGRQVGGELYEGIEAIKGYFALGKPPHTAVHMMTNCWIREEGGRTLVKMKWICPDWGTDRMILGDNNDEVVKTSNGWRIKERVATVRYPGLFTKPKE